MKKKCFLLSVMSFMLILTACNSTETKTFVYEEEGVTTEMEFTYSGDTVEQDMTTTTIEYETLGIQSQEEAEDAIQDFSSDFEEIEGADYNLEYGDSEAVETLEINYEEAELDDLREAGIEIDGDEEGTEISMEDTEANLLEEGYELTEDSSAEEE